VSGRLDREGDEDEVVALGRTQARCMLDVWGREAEGEGDLQ
jgi:hypothetical protein